jgi:hypothetical protein
MELYKCCKIVTKPAQMVSVIDQANLKNICPVWPEFSHQNYREEVFPYNFHHGDLDDRDVLRQFRIELFEMHEHLEQTVPEVSVEYYEHRFVHYREI